MMKSPVNEYPPMPSVGYPLQQQNGSFSSVESASTASSQTGFVHSKPVYGTVATNATNTTNVADADSDPEDDPGQLLNMWLGELNTLKKVGHTFIICFETPNFFWVDHTR